MADQPTNDDKQREPEFMPYRRQVRSHLESLMGEGLAPYEAALVMATEALNLVHANYGANNGCEFADTLADIYKVETGLADTH
jgi:hypothetical protein